jgi:hypothetical protein
MHVKVLHASLPPGLVRHPRPWIAKHKHEKILECLSDTHGNTVLFATVFQGANHASLTRSFWCSTPAHGSPNTNKKRFWSVHQIHTEKADYLQQYSKELIMLLSPTQCGAAPQSTVYQTQTRKESEMFIRNTRKKWTTCNSIPRN